MELSNEYTVEVVANSNGEAVLAEYIDDQEGNLIDQRTHEPPEEMKGVRLIHRCSIPASVGSLDLITLTHTGIEVEGEEFDLECVTA